MRPAGPGASPLVRLQDLQVPLQIPESDVHVEVVARLPIRAQLQDLTRLLGKRQAAPSRYRVYPPTILELIMLVKRNPAKPRGRAWNSLRAQAIGYDPENREVSVEYCIDYCDIDPERGGPHARRKMVTYKAGEDVVAARLKKKLDDLAQRP